MGRFYTIFDTAIGRCAVAWGDAGILGVQLPEARELETRRRFYKVYPDAREVRPPQSLDHAIQGVATILRGGNADLSDVALDMTGIGDFNQRVYQFARTIPRGETRSRAEVASALGVSGALHSVAQALGRNPFAIIVPCHRVLDPSSQLMSPHRGCISSRRLLSIEGVGTAGGKTLFDVLLPVAPRRPHP